MAKRIKITGNLFLPEDELQFKFVRSSGPGGQNVNKVSTAVQLRFDLLHSPSLPDSVKQRLYSLVPKRITREGILLIEAQQHRTQERNRNEAVRRLVALLRQAALKPKRRLPTHPSAAAKRKRLEAKKRRSEIKKMRRKVTLD